MRPLTSKASSSNSSESIARRLDEYGDSERLDERPRFLEGREEDGRDEEDEAAEAFGFEVRGLEVAYFSDLSEGRIAGLEVKGFPVGLVETIGLTGGGFFEKDGIGGVPAAPKNHHKLWEA